MSVGSVISRSIPSLPQYIAGYGDVRGSTGILKYVLVYWNQAQFIFLDSYEVVIVVTYVFSVSELSLEAVVVVDIE